MVLMGNGVYFQSVKTDMLLTSCVTKYIDWIKHILISRCVCKGPFCTLNGVKYWTHGFVLSQCLNDCVDYQSMNLLRFSSSTLVSLWCVSCWSDSLWSGGSSNLLYLLTKEELCVVKLVVSVSFSDRVRIWKRVQVSEQVEPRREVFGCSFCLCKMS